jgi:hypothetical protein
LLLVLFTLAIKAQEAVPASGGTASGNGGSVSYTVGQVAYITISNGGGSVSQGVQQSFEIKVISGVEEKRIDLQCSVYPNPANDYLRLKVENYNIESLRYQLFDIDGKLMLDNKIEGKETIILMEGMVPAAYFLKVTDNNKEVKTFKIIKN